MELEGRETRGNSKKLKKSACRRDVKNTVFYAKVEQYGMDSRRRLCV